MDIIKSSNLDRNNPLFYKNISPNLKNYYYIKITSREINMMLNIVLENLQLKNKYELKDKYEGDAYFNNILISYFGFKAIYSFQGKNEYINNLKIDEYIKGEIMINNLTFKISNFQFGTLPKFEPIKNESINGVIFCLYRDKDVYLCGYINTKEYNQTKTRFFENFYLLKSIDKI